MNHFEFLLNEGDRRSIGQSNTVVSIVKNQELFDDLFSLLYHEDRGIAMRAADAVEKITLENQGYLQKHKNEIFDLCQIAIQKELKWHLAQLLPRLQLSRKELFQAWQILKNWSLDKNESHIVRVNSLQSLFSISMGNVKLQKELKGVAAEIEKENIPSLDARMRKISLKK